MEPWLPGRSTRATGRLGPDYVAPVNASFPWDDFDTSDYLDHNYRVMRDDDQQILALICDLFRSSGRSGSSGLDVGTAANLYPALAMLPICAEITLWERSTSNIAWLTNEVACFSPVWDPFWNGVSGHWPQAHAIDPRIELAARARVHHGDIFSLPRNSWDLGTMFFVAESITTSKDEFDHAVAAFVGSLRPGAPFAAAFMENSRGYRVGGQDFPSVPVSLVDVRQCLAPLAHNVKVRRIETSSPLRDGYDGMLLAVGHADGNRD